MNHVLQLLGLAMRAGRLATGEEQVLQAIRSEKAYLVIIADDASQGTKQTFGNKCRSYRVPIAFCFSREELGRAIGKRERVSIAVLDKGFAQTIQEQVEIQRG